MDSPKPQTTKQTAPSVPSGIASANEVIAESSIQNPLAANSKLSCARAHLHPLMVLFAHTNTIPALKPAQYSQKEHYYIDYMDLQRLPQNLQIRVLSLCRIPTNPQQSTTSSSHLHTLLHQAIHRTR